MRKQDLEVMTQIIFASHVMGDNDFEIEKDGELMENSFITRILLKKIEVFQLPIKISKLAYILIELYSEGNPGFAQYILAKILETLKGKKEKIIKVETIVFTWPDKVPTMEGDYETWWENQKIPQGNAVDTVEFWQKLIK